MEDYEKELLADFASDSEEEAQASGVVKELRNSDEFGKSFEEKLDFVINNYSYNKLNLTSTDITHISNNSLILPLIPELTHKIDEYLKNDDINELLASIDDQSPEYKFILSINELSTIINQEIQAFHSVLKQNYEVVFPELETIIPSPIDYTRIVAIIKQDLENIKNYEDELKLITSNEKVLIIIMAAIQQISKKFTLSEVDLENILTVCDLIFSLDDILHKLINFVSLKISKFAPNVCSLIGSYTTGQLLISTGGLKQLALTPSCNLASLGVKELSSTSKKGYLYNSELIKTVPEDIKKQVIRIVSGKIILAARIDLSKSDRSGDIGNKYLDHVYEKIEKLLLPPDQTPDKALPLPVDHKSKKRGGKRMRKLKERFQMSDLRKAQNKMEFGKREDTIIDSYGDEVGLGMSKGDRISKIKINKSTNAKMSKSMIQRLQNNNNNQNDLTMINLPEIKENQKMLLVSEESSLTKWLTGMKRKKLED